MNRLKNNAIQEGIFFLLIGGTLLGYSLESYGKSFNKDWSQSPYLFPILVAGAFMLLSVSLLANGMRQVQAEAARLVSLAPQDGPTALLKKKGGAWLPVVIVLGMSLLYYASMAVLQFPYITFGILAWSFTISTFEIVTFVYLVAMMLYLGVRKLLILIPVPLVTTLFLSIAFRALLHVLLP